MKKILIILNPEAGTKKANKYLTDIIGIFVGAGYMPTVLTTTKRGDATQYAAEAAEDYEFICCIGGDGTFNETVAGIMQRENKLPLAYVPAGSTNDFARSLSLSTDILTACTDIVEGKAMPLDVGRMGDRYFSYVASFGAFTKVSYDTPQDVKNILGHLAYLLGGAAEILKIKPIHARIESEGKVFEGNYLFGAITNTTSVGGVLKLKKEEVDMNDGSFEMLLVKMPKDLTDVSSILIAVAAQTYDSRLMEFTKGSKFKVFADEEPDWSLDGEYRKGSREFEIENVHSGINLIVNQQTGQMKKTAEKEGTVKGNIEKIKEFASGKRSDG